MWEQGVHAALGKSVRKSASIMFQRGTVSESLATLVGTLDQTELAWCPFRAMDSYWRKDDIRSTENYWDGMAARLHAAGNIRCTECPCICNQGYEPGPSDLPDLEHGTLDRLVRFQRDTN